MVRTQDGASVTVTQGKLTSDDEKSLSDSFSSQSASIYPGKEVRVGESWSVPLSAVFGDTQGLPRGTASAQLVDIVNRAGHRCAHIKITSDISLKQEFSTLDLKMTGDAYFALDINREIERKASGPIHMSAQKKQDDKVMVIKSEGLVELTTSDNYAKASGTLVGTP